MQAMAAQQDFPFRFPLDTGCSGSAGSRIGDESSSAPRGRRAAAAAAPRGCRAASPARPPRLATRCAPAPSLSAAPAHTAIESLLYSACSYSACIAAAHERPTPSSAKPGPSRACAAGRATEVCCAPRLNIRTSRCTQHRRGSQLSWLDRCGMRNCKTYKHVIDAPCWG